jgi:hypothetical protein
VTPSHRIPIKAKPSLSPKANHKTLFEPVTGLCAKMEDAQVKARIKETVLKILHESNLEEVTKSMIRKQASTELDLNLNQPPFKAYHRSFS